MVNIAPRFTACLREAGAPYRGVKMEAMTLDAQTAEERPKPAGEAVVI